MIERNIYLEKLTALKDKQLIKVITGIRCSGKSTMFKLYQDYLLSNGVNKTQIISINFENADFFLPLLDPENKAHERYLNAGTSGTFQLVYDFNDGNSIVYAKNNTLSQAMKTAIDKNATEYSSLQNNLKSLVQEIEKFSSENLKGMLNA